jgi:hypothetical protein
MPGPMVSLQFGLLDWFVAMLESGNIMFSLVFCRLLLAWRTISPPLPGQEPEDLRDDDGEVIAEEDDDEEVTELDSEAAGQGLAGRTHGTKRGATSSSQPSREEGTEDQEEEATSPPKGKGLLKLQMNSGPRGPTRRSLWRRTSVSRGR